MSIYIYSPELYKSNDFLIIGSICICLTIISSIMMSVAIMDTNKKHYILDEEIVIPNVAIQAILLSLIIFLGYVFNVLFGLIFLFYSFLTTYFGILSIFIIINLFSEKNNQSK